MTRHQKLSQFYFIVILLLATPWFVFDPYYAEDCYVFHGGPVVSILLNVSIHHQIVVHIDQVFFVHLMVDSVKITCCWLMSPHRLTQPSVDWVYSSLMFTCKASRYEAFGLTWAIGGLLQSWKGYDTCGQNCQKRRKPVVQLELISAHRFDNSITPQLQDLVCRVRRFR